MARMSSLRARWIDFRNRRLGDPAFQRWAAAFPLTRRKARTEAQQLFDLVAGFAASQILVACTELRICERLAEGAATEFDLAEDCNIPLQSMQRLMRGAAALGLVEAVGGSFMLGPRGAALLGNPGVGAMIAHHRHFYADMADPVALLRRGGGGGALEDYWSYARDGAPEDATPSEVADYSALMAASQPMVAEQVIAAYPLQKHRRLLDVGGGEGRFVRTVAAAVPGLDLAVFDLPAVAERARTILDSDGLQRVETFGGSFFDDPLPAGFDLITLVRIVHDHDDEPVLRLLRAIFAALPDGGTLLIAEPMANATPSSVGDVYFGFYLLAMGQGRARAPAEIVTLLTAAGFARTRHISTPLPLAAQIIVAKKAVRRG